MNSQITADRILESLTRARVESQIRKLQRLAAGDLVENAGRMRAIMDNLNYQLDACELVAEQGRLAWVRGGAA